MKFSSFLVLAPVAAAGVVRRNVGPQAVYFLDNNPEGASIVSLKVSNNGMLSDPVRTSTGGKGMYVMGAGNTAPMVDSLTSQNALIASGKYLLAVNPGSNTVTLFTIPENDPTQLKMVGEPVSSGGQFPNTVAFSSALNVACVMNTGAMAGVMCYDVANDGLHPMGDFMPLPVNETTPPIAPPNDASDIVFSPSNKGLFVTVKGDGVTPGFIAAYPIEGGKVSSNVQISRPTELLVDFSLSFIDDTHAVITDPSFGAAYVEICYPCLNVLVTKKIIIPGQAATCWSQYSKQFDAVYLFDGGNPNITALDPVSGDIKYVIPAPASNLGSFDSVVAGEYLYVLEGIPGISVFSLGGGFGLSKIPTLVQNLDLTSLGSRQGWQGMAAWPMGY